MSDHAPILLRPHLALADAMTAAAEASGCSRQVWMLAVLADAVTELGHYPPTGVGADDVPLFEACAHASRRTFLVGRADQHTKCLSCGVVIEP